MRTLEVSKTAPIEYSYGDVRVISGGDEGWYAVTPDHRIHKLGLYVRPNNHPRFRGILAAKVRQVLERSRATAHQRTR
jgi:hypothetical protein